MDKYTKIVLTMIAILLTLHLFKPFLFMKDAKAGSGITDVNIVKVDNRFIHKGIPVIIK